MKNNFLLVLLMVISVLMSCKQETNNTMVDNILLKEWTGPYGGVPAFNLMKVEDVKDAMLEGMKLNLEDIDAIANNKAAPTFENTIESMERAGKELDTI